MIDTIDKKTIEGLLPHREPMLLIDKLINIVPLKSATAIMYVKKNGFYVQGHFPGQPVMPGVLIVEAFGQAAAALMLSCLKDVLWKELPIAKDVIFAHHGDAGHWQIWNS